MHSLFPENILPSVGERGSAHGDGVRALKSVICRSFQTRLGKSTRRDGDRLSHGLRVLRQSWPEQLALAHTSPISTKGIQRRICRCFAAKRSIHSRRERSR